MNKAKSTDELPDQVQEVVYCLNIGSLLSEKYGSRSVTDIQHAIRKQFADDLKARIVDYESYDADIIIKIIDETLLTQIP